MIFDLQKASILKRASAFLLDVILLVILATGFMLAASAITGYDDYGRQLADKYDYYEDLYNIDTTKEEYTEEDLKNIQKAEEAMQADSEAVWLYNMVFSLTLAIVSIGVFLSYAVLEFVVPLLLKNGMTVGKRIFGIAIIRTDGVKMVPMALFIRTFIGKFAIETMVPALIIIMFVMNKATFVTLAVLVLIPIFELILIIATKNNYLIHDVLSGTVAVDMASQMIFESSEELLEYKKRVYAEYATRQEY